MKKRHIHYNLILVAMLAAVLSGCEKKTVSEDAVSVFYVNSSETGIISKEYELQSDKENPVAQISELIELLRTMPDRLQYEAPISGDIELIGYNLQDHVLTLNFNPKYKELDGTVEILDRAAIVRTMTQLEVVDYVSFQIEGTPLTDHNGKIIGNMSADTFIYNVGNEINTYEKVELKLYFATVDGNKLIPVFRSVVYNSNISMERLMVEQLVSGPNTDLAIATVSKDSKINSVNVKDGVCYVDFDNGFLSQPNKISAEVAIYSIVDTLTELPNVNKVVFSINGTTPFTYMDASIGGAYERNLDIVE